MSNVQRFYGSKIQFASNEYEVLNNVDALVICTEWGIFRNPDFNRMKELMNDTVIFDGRNLFDLEEMTGKGFYYSSIGRTSIENK
jgi:UDPglucose 6-dehydrogenase